MYKTVRHGENSLQYTILPQTEEVLNNSGLKGKGRDYSPSIHVRRSQRRSTVKYVLLIIFGVVIALALASVPLYVMNGALYARKVQQNHHDIVTVVPASAGRELVKSRKKELKILPDMASTLTAKTEISSATNSVTSSTLSTANETVTKLPWTVATIKTWKSSTIPGTNGPETTEAISGIPVIPKSTSSRLLQNKPSMRQWDKDFIIRPTVTTDSVNVQLILTSEKATATNAKLFDDVLITTKTTSTNPSTTDFITTMGSNFKDDIFAMDDEDDLKASLQFDDMFPLPSLKPNPTDVISDSDEVTISRWPFVDISSYFPWTGYSIGDNLLLPLLIATLSSIALVLLLALAVKRRKRSQAASAQIGLTADLQADDNTKLLTTDNVEDAEE